MDGKIIVRTVKMKMKANRFASEWMIFIHMNDHQDFDRLKARRFLRNIHMQAYGMEEREMQMREKQNYQQCQLHANNS